MPKDARHFSAEERADLTKTIEGLGDIETGLPVGAEEDEEVEAEESVSGETDDTEVDGTPDGSEEEDESQEDDVPTEYMGLDLSDIDVDTRKAILAKFAESDANYTRLSQRLKGSQEEQKPEGEGEAASEEEAQPFNVDDLDDDKVLEMLGYDPSDELQKEFVAPLGRQVIQLAGMVQNLTFEREVERFASEFNSSLDEAEAEFGADALPDEYSRDDVLSVMETQGIRDPKVAFKTLVGEARNSFVTEVEAARKAAREKAKKRINNGGSRKPPASGTTPEPVPIMDGRAATRAAVEELAAKGFDFG